MLASKILFTIFALPNEGKGKKGLSWREGLGVISGKKDFKIYFLELVVVKDKLVTFATLFGRNGIKSGCF